MNSIGRIESELDCEIRLISQVCRLINGREKLKSYTRVIAPSVHESSSFRPGCFPKGTQVSSFMNNQVKSISIHHIQSMNE